MGIDIVPVDPLDPAQTARFAAWRNTIEASDREQYGDDHAAYSADEYRAMFCNQRYERRIAWAAVRDGTVVGHLDVMLHLTDNPRRLDFALAVHPDHRRLGIGSALAQHVERVAHDEGRTVLGTESDVATARDDPARGFAARHGYTAAQRELRSRLDLPVDVAGARAEAEKHAEDYDVLTSWDGIPDEWLADRALLSRRMSTDVPLGQLDFDEQEWDTDRVRQDFELAREQGRRVVETVARHRASGQIVAYTDIAVARREPRAWQWATLVLSEHRGHRLGLLVKAANLQALVAELPHVRSVHTWNAGENEPMLRVNRALGFVPVGRLTEWQKTLG